MPLPPLKTDAKPQTHEDLDPFILSKLDEISTAVKAMQKVQAATTIPSDFCDQVKKELEQANSRLYNIGCCATILAAAVILSVLGFIGVVVLFPTHH